jgi:hypothetical protein
MAVTISDGYCFANLKNQSLLNRSGLWFSLPIPCPSPAFLYAPFNVVGSIYDSGYCLMEFVAGNVSGKSIAAHLCAHKYMP